MAQAKGHKFWVPFTSALTLILFLILFPMLLDKYGWPRALLWSCLIPIAMTLAYLRGWWVASLISKHKKKTRDRNI
jgi:hypothetical protein